jgi:hypothetical protein
VHTNIHTCRSYIYLMCHCEYLHVRVRTYIHTHTRIHTYLAAVESFFNMQFLIPCAFTYMHKHIHMYKNCMCTSYIYIYIYVYIYIYMYIMEPSASCLCTCICVLRVCDLMHAFAYDGVRMNEFIPLFMAVCIYICCLSLHDGIIRRYVREPSASQISG